MAMKLYLDNLTIERSFEQAKATLPGHDQPWLNDLRASAMARFVARGIPGPKVEEWKYTNLNFLANENFEPSQGTSLKDNLSELAKKTRFDHLDGPVIVFVDGYFAGDLSDLKQSDGLDLTLFSENPDQFKTTLEKLDGATSLDELNKALITDGYILSVAAGCDVAEPVQIIHLISEDSIQQAIRTRAQINLAKGARLQVVESFIGPANVRYWSHMVSDIELAADAMLEYCQFQQQGDDALHMTESHNNLAKNATFNHTSLQLGGALNRTELINDLAGAGAEVNLRGAYLGRGRQSHDIYTRINHDQPHCQSDQLFRGVLDQGGKSAYQGKVVVARHAQKTQADQSNKSLLLSRKTEANAKPELLIYADDVKCSHGATVGELDKEQYFYLLSRGLDPVAAKGLLVEAFVSEVFDHLDDAPVKDRFKALAANWLKPELKSEVTS